MYMKANIQTIITLALLLPLTGCWNSSEPKKHEQHEKGAVAGHGHEEKHSGKCSHKGCKHDHSKDGHKKHRDEVKTQSMNEYDDEDEDDMDDDVMTQSMDMDDDYDDEE